MSRSHELQPEELELVSGGGSTRLFSDVTVGPTPSHNYGLISDSFGANLTYSQANAIVQRFNAPTYDALYGQGNDPAATSGIVSRPGAQDLHSTQIPVLGWPADAGGKVTLAHGDGYAVNTTVDGQHLVEGTISRNLVSDFHDGGGYQVLSLGQGQGGAKFMTTGGEVIGAGIGFVLGGKSGAEAGSAIGGAIGQNAAHLVNPDVGAVVFSQLDNGMLANVNGTHNPNLDLPSGRDVEAGYVAGGVTAGIDSALGHSPVAHGSDVQHEALYELTHDLNGQGTPVTGSFALSANNVGIYHFTADGSKYYEMDNGHVVERQVDESSGVDAAVAHQAALNGDHPQSVSESDIHLPDPPAQIIGLPPELTPHDGNTQSGPDHSPSSAPPATDGPHGDASDVIGAPVVVVDTGSHAPDTGSHGNDVAVAPVDAAPVIPVSTAPAPAVDIPIIPIDIPPVIPIQVDAPLPVIAPIPVLDVPVPENYGAYSTVNPMPVVPPVDPGIDTAVAGIGSLDVGGYNYGSGFDAGGYVGGFDGGGFDGGGFDGGIAFA